MSHFNYIPLRAALLSLTVFSLTFAAQTLQAQTKIGGTAGPGDASAVLELQSTAQGFLHPRMTTTQRDNINNPATGLTIYNTTTNCIQVYKGAGNGGWHDLCNTAGGSFTFTNCNNPVITGSFSIGQTATATIQLNYTNNTGQTLAAFSTNTVSGITLNTPGGSVTPVTAGNGSITLTASGIPIASGTVNIPVVLAGAACNISVNVAGCSDPGATPGSTGCVAFTYRGQPVIHTTVRAKDGKIWLQQNLGSSRVPTSSDNDFDAIGDVFQWGRWDDGHQVRVPASTAVNTPPSPNNPSGISSGSSLFYWGTGSTRWWASGAVTDTWTDAAPGATNGKDPCAAIGTGWHMPTQAEWVAVINAANENITNLTTGYASNLKLSRGAFREHINGNFNTSVTAAWYWSSTPSSATDIQYFYTGTSAANSASTANLNPRALGMTVRCVK